MKLGAPHLAFEMWVYAAPRVKRRGHPHLKIEMWGTQLRYTLIMHNFVTH
jgi:hypothetical protein